MSTFSAAPFGTGSYIYIYIYKIFFKSCFVTITVTSLKSAFIFVFEPDVAFTLINKRMDAYLLYFKCLLLIKILVLLLVLKKPKENMVIQCY